MSGSDFFEFEVSPLDANDWWQRNNPAGTLLNRLMLLFILVPIALVWKQYYVLSFIIFAFMVPYGLFVRHLAVRAVRAHLSANPEQVREFERQGIISC